MWEHLFLGCEDLLSIPLRTATQLRPENCGLAAFLTPGDNGSVRGGEVDNGGGDSVAVEDDMEAVTESGVAVPTAG